MAQVASLQDFRQEGPPGDIGVFQATATVIVYPFTFSGTTYYVAQRMGVRGWTLVNQGTDVSTVLHSTINALTSGETIFLKLKGIHTLNRDILISTDYIAIDAEEGTVLKVKNEPRHPVGYASSE